MSCSSDRPCYVSKVRLEKLASIIGILAAIGAVWTRFVVLEERADNTDKTLVRMTEQMGQMTEQLHQLDIKIAKLQPY